MEKKLDNKLEMTVDYYNTTSPSQLQEVTLDPDVTTNFSYMGLRSPGALNSGRSVKEIDEQLTCLRKENFNLKLRIYFLEERMGANFNTDKEDAIKKNIELMVELENVRKELEDKQELLCQAAKALEIEEEEKKKEVLTRDQEISTLKEALEEVESQLQAERLENKQLALCTQAFDLNPDESNNTEIIRKLQSTIIDLQTELKKERERADQFESLIKVAESVRVKCETLETEVRERDNKLFDLVSKLDETKCNISKCNVRINVLEKELKEKCNELENTVSKSLQNEIDLQEYQGQLMELKNQYDTVQLQKDRCEKKTEKYKSLLTRSENKNIDMITYADTLKSKIQNLEVRLAAALHEVKRTNSKTDNISSVEQRHKPNNTDVALFSVRNASPVPETSTSPSKITSQINRSHKTIYSVSPTLSSSSSHSQINSDKHSNETNEIVRQASPDVKNTSTSNSATGDAQLSQEEASELKRNHYKACKIIKSMIQKKKEYLEQITKFEKIVNEQNIEIQHLQEKITELTESSGTVILSAEPKRKSIQEKVSELNITASSNPAANKENSMAGGDEMHLAEQYKELTIELETKIEVLTATLDEKDSQLERLKIEMQAKANRIIDLEFELLALNQGVNRSLDSSSEKEDTAEKSIQEQEKEQKIQQLENELRKRTCDLQGIVNKELWEKNRSIEKLQTILKSKNQEIEKLEKNAYGKELQLKILKDKINELGVHVNLPPGLIAADSRIQINSSEDSNDVNEQLKVCLEERKHFIQEIEELRTKLKNIPEHDENKSLLQLKSEYNDLRKELENSEKLRQESQEICSVLSTRLEELCYFLDSLLKHKSVLGLLGIDQARKLQQVVNKSLDLSRTLSTTIALNPDESLLQLSNISNLLNSTRNDSLNFNDFFGQDEENYSVLSIIPSDITLTYQSHLNPTYGNGSDNTQVIKVLRQQVANLKREIEVRDVELGKKLAFEPVTVEKSLQNDEQFVDALADFQPHTSSLQISTPDTILQNLVSDTSKLNTTTSTLVAEKSTVSNTTSTTLKNLNIENQSESESWSEPDRTISMARIGLHEESLKRPSTGTLSKRNRFATDSNLSTESTEADHTHSLSKTPSKRTTLAESRQTIIALHEQVCELETKLKEKENQLLSAQVAFYETDNSLKREQTMVQEIKRENSELAAHITELNKQLEEAEKQKNKVQQEVKQMEVEHSQLLQQIKETNGKLEESEKQKEEAEKKMSELQNVVAVLEEFRKNVEAQMDSKDKQMQNTINEMEIEKTKAIEAAQNAERILEKAKRDMQVAEKELKNMLEREQKIREELENTYRENLKKAEEHYEAQANKYREATMQIKESYEKDYIRKIEVEELTKELENLSFANQEYRTQILAMEEKEIKLKNKILDLQDEHREKVSELHINLDNATLQYSEAVLEKTKLRNENNSLQQQVQKLCGKESELIKQVNSNHNELEETKINLEAQIAQLEHQKTLVELKVNDLENINSKLQSINAELHARLIEAKANRYVDQPMSSMSLPNNPSSMLELFSSGAIPITVRNFSTYTRQLSDQSGYTSEDIQGDDVGSKGALAQMQHLLEPIDAEHERQCANSSPDLGIESDHGRFSSLEANVTIPRPLLPSLELAQSMSNLLDPLQDMMTCTNEECCKKAKQICSENVDLRKRLLRTRRALEDTLTRLKLANKQKKEVEKSICKQILYTNQVLRKAKANLDQGSETDVKK